MANEHRHYTLENREYDKCLSCHIVRVITAHSPNSQAAAQQFIIMVIIHFCAYASCSLAVRIYVIDCYLLLLPPYHFLLMLMLTVPISIRLWMLNFHYKSNNSKPFYCKFEVLKPKIRSETIWLLWRLRCKHTQIQAFMCFFSQQIPMVAITTGNTINFADLNERLRGKFFKKCIAVCGLLVIKTIQFFLTTFHSSNRCSYTRSLILQLIIKSLL